MVWHFLLLQPFIMKVSAIAAVAYNRALGKDDDLPWRLHDDMKFFKRTTLHHHVIMGRKTFDTMGRPLPKRTNIIITRNPYFLVQDSIVVGSIEEALGFAEKNGESEAMVIGGAQIYQLSLPYLDRLYYTEVHANPEADTFFPEVDWSEWELVESTPFKADDRNEYDFTIKVFDRVPS